MFLFKKQFVLSLSVFAASLLSNACLETNKMQLAAAEVTMDSVQFLVLFKGLTLYNLLCFRPVNTATYTWKMYKNQRTEG